MFVVGAWFFANTVGHVQERFDIWLDPFADPEGDGFQVAQSLFAQADGGLFGRGLGESLVQLPEITPKCADDFPNCGAILPAPAHGLHLRRDRRTSSASSAAARWS